MGYFACGVVGMAVAPSVDPITTTLQAVPLFILFEGSIWLSAMLERRDEEQDERRCVSADWVIPVDGPPIRDGYVSWEDGRITEVGEGRKGKRHLRAR